MSSQRVLFYLVVSLCIGVQSGFARVDIDKDQVHQALSQVNLEHPRLLWTKTDTARVKARIQSDQLLSETADLVIQQAKDMAKQPPLKRIQTGRRLLSVSREFLQRMTYWGTAYRLTADKAIVKRAEKEMLTVAEFSDWNPSHFLDVAEMTLGMAIGYDWFYHDLSESTRTVLKKAILDKGVLPSLDRRYNGWVRSENNWNQVCHAGMVFGALAVMEDEPELAEQMVHRAVNSVQIAMHEYAPQGAYPEGPGYWAYGTTFNVVLLEGLKTVLKTDFGLYDMPGFAQTPWYYVHMIAPSGKYFNYSDCGSSSGYSVALAWFAGKHDAKTLQMYERQSLKTHVVKRSRGRLFPLSLLWSTQPQGGDNGSVDWRSDGATPVVVHRSAWEDKHALYLGIKAGSPQANHAHMDVGSFVLEADGVRWGLDLGAQNYNSLESLGMNIWDRSQDSDRWHVFRYTNQAHSTLVIQGQPQVVKGFSPIKAYEASDKVGYAVIDMTPVYANQVEFAWRGFKWLESGQVLIQDDLKVTKPSGTIRWAMVTEAKVTCQDTRAVLQQDGKTLSLDAVSPERVTWQVYSAQSPHDHDAPNKGVSLVGFEVPVSSAGAQSLSVLITPGSKKAALNENKVFKPIEAW